MKYAKNSKQHVIPKREKEMKYLQRDRVLWIWQLGDTEVRQRSVKSMTSNYLSFRHMLSFFSSGGSSQAARDKKYKNFLLVLVATWGIENSKACPEGRAPSLSQKNKHCQLWGLGAKDQGSYKERASHIHILIT